MGAKQKTFGLASGGLLTAMICAENSQRLLYGIVIVKNW